MLKPLKTFDIFNKYLIALIILGIPLYPKFPLIGVPGTYVSIRLEDFLIFTALTFFIIGNANTIKKYFSDKVFIAIGVFILTGLLSVISAAYLTHSVSVPIALLHWIRRIEYISLFPVGYAHLKKYPQDLNYFIKLVPIVIFLSFLYGYGQKYFNFPIVITQNEEYSKGVALRYVEGSHINATFAGHYDLATYLVLMLPLILALIVSTVKISKILLTVVYLCGLWLLVNTASRISLVAFMISSTAALVLLKKFRKGFVYILLSILFIGFSSNLINRYQRVLELVSSNLKKYTISTVNIVNAQETPFTRRESAPPTPTPLPVFEDRSTSIRLNVEWPRAVRALVKNPLLGTGYSSITLATDNDYLRLLGESGILGFLSFTLIFASIGRIFAKYYKKGIKPDINSIFAIAFTGGFVGILINAIFIDVFEASKFAMTFWLMAGMYYYLISGNNKIND